MCWHDLMGLLVPLLLHESMAWGQERTPKLNLQANCEAWVNASEVQSKINQTSPTCRREWGKHYSCEMWIFLCRSTTVITKTLVNTPKHIPNTTHNICKTILTHKVYKVLWQFLLHFFFFFLMLGATPGLKNTVLDKLLWIFSQHMRMYHTV